MANQEPPADDFGESAPDTLRVHGGEGDAARRARDAALSTVEATLILIAHPTGRLLGRLYRLAPGGRIEVGRAGTADVSLPDVASVSRRHASLYHDGEGVVLQDLGSTNGTLVNDSPLEGAVYLRNGDRVQMGEIHFKFLHEPDVEHAYHLAVSELVTRDGLTQAYNRRRFEEELHREWSRALRYGRPLSLLLFDLDRFKDVNDAQGHPFGDLVLKRTAECVARGLRAETVFARLGGDEFAVLCPELDGTRAAQLAERLRAAIAALEHVHGGETRSVTASFGVAERLPEMTQTDAIYAAADAALYQSKQAGGDRVALAG
jgi:diguanylate cyclase (GGDEF)-like protein